MMRSTRHLAIVSNSITTQLGILLFERMEFCSKVLSFPARSTREGDDSKNKTSLWGMLPVLVMEPKWRVVRFLFFFCFFCSGVGILMSVGAGGLHI